MLLICKKHEDTKKVPVSHAAAAAGRHYTDIRIDRFVIFPPPSEHALKFLIFWLDQILLKVLRSVRIFSIKIEKMVARKIEKNKQGSPSQSISSRIDGKFIESSAHVIEIRGNAFLLVANKISDTC